MQVLLLNLRKNKTFKMIKKRRYTKLIFKNKLSYENSSIRLIYSKTNSKKIVNCFLFKRSKNLIPFENL